ncbi:sulfite exporter TauE/SafE family protein [Thalassovita aquimarina]|uniref:Probable membrane transporter protein n=1 Tax=Thalassovita aquimarina TaxID=2785917 RepID=A0ABS5HUJ1_9RHOB|nr:sulfite exporter TauE/SafE family protein [Thalassovita aquimarina]MBR9652629.1 sulfite exporter TauE/SafE family protein [Thalassovita aquimarina]
MSVGFDPVIASVTIAAVFLISFMKGAFGGGFAIVGIPLLALVMDPIEAGALLAPLFVAMDLVALRFWSPATWSKPDLKVLLPALVVGIALGTWLLGVLDPGYVAILIGLLTLVFAIRWFLGGGQPKPRARSVLKAAVAGTASGMTTMLAHSGGPPLAIYLLPLGLPKNVYAGTTSLFFTAGNLIKAVPWLWIWALSVQQWGLMALCLPAIPAGVWAGWRLHERLDQVLLYRILYALLVVVALKLIWDGASGG